MRSKLPSHVTLPLHVVARPRGNGTFNVLYRVRKNRPDDWPSSIPLPIQAPRTGNLNDKSELARIAADAAMLAERLEQARGDVIRPEFPANSMPAVAALWEAAWAGDLRERTQNFYRKSLRPLLAWSAVQRHPPLGALELPMILKFLAEYKDRPAQQAALRRTLSALLSFARAQGIIDVHPLGAPVRVKKMRKMRKVPVALWDAAIVQTYADAADAAGWPMLANLILLMWETSADATDCVTWRNGAHLPANADVIHYTRGKTGERAAVPISAALAARLRKSGIFLCGDPQGRPYEAESVKADERRGTDFRRLRKRVVDAGGPSRVLDHLRHSAVTDALTKGAKLEHMPSLTAHRGEHMVEAIYSQMTEAQARAVQKARGIVE